MLPTLSPQAIVSSGRVAGSGIHREGHLVADVCVKLALGYGGQDANRYEIDGWSAIEGTPDAELFAPVLAYDPGAEWVVMPKCSPVGWYTVEEAVRAGEDADDIVPDGQGFKVHRDLVEWRQSYAGRRARALVSDLHAFNVMRHPDGHLVVTDYGMGLGEDISEDALAAADDSFRECPGCDECCPPDDADADWNDVCKVAWQGSKGARWQCVSCNWYLAPAGICGCFGCNEHWAGNHAVRPLG